MLLNISFIKKDGSDYYLIKNSKTGEEFICEPGKLNDLIQKIGGIK